MNPNQLPPVPGGIPDLSQIAAAPQIVPNKIGVKFPGGIREFDWASIKLLNEDEFRLFVLTILCNNPMDPDFQRVFGPPAEDGGEVAAAPVTEAVGHAHPFGGFTPEHGYEVVGDLFEVDSRTVAQPVKFNGVPMVVLAVLPDPEDTENDDTVTRYVHIEAETAGRILKGMHPHQTPISADGGDGDTGRDAERPGLSDI